MLEAARPPPPLSAPSEGRGEELVNPRHVATVETAASIYRHSYPSHGVGPSPPWLGLPSDLHGRALATHRRRRHGPKPPSICSRWRHRAQKGRSGDVCGKGIRRRRGCESFERWCARILSWWVDGILRPFPFGWLLRPGGIASLGHVCRFLRDEAICCRA